MKKSLYTLILLLLVAITNTRVNAQCPFNNTFYVNLTPAASGTTVSDGCVYGGDLITVNVISGETYIISLCSNAGFEDSEITLYNATGTTVLGYNDDFCGLYSQVTYTATYTGVLNVLIDEYPCTTASNCMQLDVTWVGAASCTNDNCSTAIPLSTTGTQYCGNNSCGTLGGTGDYSMSCTFGGDATQGAIWFSFVAPASGAVTITTDYAGTTFDTQLNLLGDLAGVASSCPATMYEYGCSEDDGIINPLASTITVGALVPGQTYWIQLDGYSGEVGNYCISVTELPCTASVGTFSSTVNGSPVSTAVPQYICFGGCYTVTSNNNYTLPSPNCGVSELMYAIYTSYPTVTDPNIDPAWTGYYWTGEDFSDCNNGASVFNTVPTLTGFTTYWLVPITADDGDDDDLFCPGLHHDNNGDGCFDVGAPIEFHYLNQIAATITTNPCTGVATVTVTGGLPQDNGSNYTITNTGPGTMTGTPITHGGSVTISGLTNGQTVTLSISDGQSCSLNYTSAPVVVTIPTTANAGPDQSICASPGTTSLAGNTPTTGTGSWTFVSGPSTPTITTPSSATSGVTGLTSAGTYVFQWNIAVAGCTSSTDQVSIVVTGTPTTANAGPDQSICASTGSVTLAGNTPTSGTGTWTFVSGPSTPTITTPGSPTSTVTGLTSAGTYILRWTIANAPCPSSSDLVSIVVSAVPTTANAGPDQSICASTGTVILAGNTATTGTGVWTFVSGPSTPTITTPGSPTSTVTGLTSAGTYILQWTISNAPCPSTNDQVSIVVTAAPTVANAGVDQSICSSTGTVTLAGNTATTGTGTWTFVSGPSTPTITTPGSPTSTVTGLTSAGTYILQWTISNAPCPSTSDQVSIVVTAAPTVANAGPDQSICASTGSVTLAGNTATTGTGTWTFVSGPSTPIITTPGSPTSTVTGLTSAGTYILQWTITNAPCPSTNDQVSIVVSAAPTVANAGIDQSICSSTGTVTLAGNTATTGTGTWTFVSGPSTPTITTPGSPTSTVTGLTGAGTYILQWTITNAPCPSTSDQVSIVVTAAPTVANAGPDQSICASTGSVTLAGNTATTGTGTWTFVSGPSTPTITTPGSPTSTVTGLTSAGTYILQWTITNAPCPSTNDQVSIVVTAAPTVANAGVDQTICTTSGSVTLAGNTATSGTGVWTFVSGPSTPTITTPGSPTSTVTGLTSAGTYILQWTISNAPCPSTNDQVSIFVSAPPTIANSGVPQTICASSGTVTMAANTATVGTGSWSQISGPVIGSITTPGSPTTTITGLTTPGSYVFQWAITNNPCTPSTSNVTITVNGVPTASVAGPNQSVCSNVGSVTMAANAPSVGTGVWTQVSGPSAATITTPSSPTSTITGLTTVGTYVFQWTISNAPCASSSSTVSINVNPVPSFSIGTVTNPSACGASDGSIQLTGLNPSTTYTITYNDGATVSLGSVTTDATGNYVITGLNSGSYSTFTVTNSFTCTTTVPGPVNLVDPSSPTGTAGTAFTNPTTCGGTDGTITISGLTASSTYDISYSDGTSIITLTGVTSDASGNYVITGLGDGTYSGFSLTLAGCTGSATGSVTLTEPASPTFTVGGTFTNPTTCGGTDGTITITGLNASTTYSITYVGPSGSTTISGTTNASGTYVITGLGAGSYSNFDILLSGCTGSSTVTVTLTDPAVPSFVPGSASLNPTTCGGSDGTITISGLNPSTNYIISYEGPSGAVSLGTVTTDASGNYVVTGLPSGTYFNFSVTNPTTGCSTLDALNSVNLTDPGAPSFTITGAGTNPTTCGGTDGSFSITGLNPSTTYDFSYDNGAVVTVTGTTDASGNYTVTGLGAGTYVNISVTITGCTSVNSTAIVLTDPGAPTFTLSSTNPSVCGGNDGTITISGLNPSTGYDISYDTTGGTVVLGTITSDGSGNIVITGLGAGSYTNITVTLLGCSGVDAVGLTVTDPGAPAIASVTGTDPSCGGNDGSLTISGLTPSTSYTVSYNDGTSTITVTATSDASGNIVIGSLSAGTYSSISVTIGACTSTSASTVTLTTPAPQVANAGPDQTICGFTSTMAGNAVTAGTGTWSVVSGTASFANANSESTSVSGLALGTNVLVWTIVNGSCPVSSDTVVITTETPVTTADAGLDQTLCDTATMVTLVANDPVTGTGAWTISSGSGTITNALNDSTTVTGLTGSITLTWTISTTGICPSSSDDVVITLDNCVDFTGVPSGFTPDGDGTNDTWEIPGLSENYPECQIEIFTRWGAKIFVSDKGYTEPWDGRYNGSNMPLGAYYFVIYFNDGSTEPMKGTVTIIR